MTVKTSNIKLLPVKNEHPLDYVHSIIKKNDILSIRGADLIKLAKLYTRQGQGKEALNILSDAVDVAKTIKLEKVGPKSRIYNKIAAADILIGVAEAYYNVERHGQATGTLQRALEIILSESIQVDADDYIFEIAKLFYGNGDKKRALKILNDVSCKIITGYFLSEDMNKFIRLIRTEAETYDRPDNVPNPNIGVLSRVVGRYKTLCQKLIETYCDIGLPDIAKSFAEKFFCISTWMEFNRDFLRSRTELYAYIADTYAKNGDIKKASKLLKEAGPDLTRRNTYVWSIAYARCGNWENAFKVAGKVNELGLVNDVYLYIAEVAIQKGKKNIAKKALNTAIKGAGDDESPYHTLKTLNWAVNLLLQMGDSKKAVVLCNKAFQCALEHHDEIWDFGFHDDNLIGLVCNCVKTKKEQDALRLLRKILKFVAVQEPAYLRSTSALCVVRVYLDNGIAIGIDEVKLLKKIDPSL